MKTQNKKKNLKPIEFHVNLKYKCPQCFIDHWLSLKETQTKGFIVVCDCGCVFKVRQVDTIKVIHTKKQKIQEKIKVDIPDDLVEIPEPLLKSCITILASYGFTTEEAATIIKDQYYKDKTDNVSDLIKNCLKSIGGINNG